MWSSVMVPVGCGGGALGLEVGSVPALSSAFEAALAFRLWVRRSRAAAPTTAPVATAPPAAQVMRGGRAKRRGSGIVRLS